MLWPSESSPGYKSPNMPQRYVIFNTVKNFAFFLTSRVFELYRVTTSLSLRSLCEIRTLVVIIVLVVVVVFCVCFVVSFILFPSFMSVVKNRRIFCTVDSSVIRNQKIFMTKYIEQHIFWTIGTNDLKEMFAGKNPTFFKNESGT
jgi:hypothetical protein